MASPQAIRNHAASLIKQGKFEEAQGIYVALASLDAHDIESRLQLAFLLREAGEFARAQNLYDGILKDKPQNVSARAGKALTFFHEEKFEEAWKAYVVRFEMQEKPPVVTVMRNGVRIELPRWNGSESISTLLVMAEQGLGDTLQFVRYVPELLKRNIKVSLVAPRRLHKLLRDVCAGVTLLPLEEARSVAANHWCALLDLPYILKIKPENYNKPAVYLHSNPDKWRQIMLEKAKGARLLIGINWQGNPDPSIDQGRSVPLEMFKPLAEMPDVALFSLQKGHGEEQLASCSFRNRIITLDDVDTGDDGFIDTASIMQNLDFVVSSCTSTPHLAGALGVPVKLMLKTPGCDWRWLARPKTSIWYENHTLYRQSKPGDWASVMAEIIDDLLPHIASPSLVPDLFETKSLLAGKIADIFLKEQQCEDAEVLKNLILTRMALQDKWEQLTLTKADMARKNRLHKLIGESEKLEQKIKQGLKSVSRETLLDTAKYFKTLDELKATKALLDS
jgi:tetratricopeptide (TPR) repeat protein